MAGGMVEMMKFFGTCERNDTLATESKRREENEKLQNQLGLRMFEIVNSLNTYESVAAYEEAKNQFQEIVLDSPSDISIVAIRSIKVDS